MARSNKKNKKKPTTRKPLRRSSMPLYGSRTDVGLVREHNEDSLMVSPPLYVVADGMGGHAAGEVASEIAVQAMADNAPETLDPDELARAVVAANRAIIRAAATGHGRKGMGTTMTAAMVIGERLNVAQVGDSRAYLLHEGKLQRITRDHSLVADLVEEGKITEEEARVHPNRSVITRALGSDPRTLPDIYEMNVAAGDRLLLCSDGLTSMVVDQDIEEILSTVRDPQNCANKLTDAAICAGGFDNITVIVVDIVGNAEKELRKAARKSYRRAVLGVVSLIAVLAIAAFGVGAYLNHVAFVTLDGDEVVICRGLPGQIMGIQTWQYDHDTGVDVNTLDLPENTKSRLVDEGIRVDSVSDADALVSSWTAQAEQSRVDNAAIEGDNLNGSSSSSSSASSTSSSSSTSGTTSGSTSTSGTSTSGSSSSSTTSTQQTSGGSR